MPTESPTEIHLHLGAHKTATKYVQSLLRENADELGAEGITYIDLWARAERESAYRAALKAGVEGDEVDREALGRADMLLREIVAQMHSAADHGGGRRMVLSYENLLGGYDLTRGPGIYPHAAETLGRVLDVFADYSLVFHFSVRSFDRFIESGYVQRVYTRREIRSWKDYLAAIDLGAVSWVELLDRLDHRVRGSELRLWKYEDFKDNEATVLSSLLGHDAPAALLTKPARGFNPSLSAKGMKYMRAINRTVATDRDAKVFRRVVKRNFGVQQGQKPPSYLDEDLRAEFESRYESEVDEIRSRWGMIL